MAPIKILARKGLQNRQWLRCMLVANKYHMDRIRLLMLN